MHRTKWISGGLRLVTVVAVCAILAPATSNADSAVRPFKATETSYVVAEGPSPTCGPGEFLVEIAGAGVGTHVGKYSDMRQHCFNFAAETFEGTFTFTAANGDQLSGTYAGVLTALGGGLFVIDGTWQVTGGSGRFVAANGSGVLQGLFTLSTASAEVEHVGAIQY